jgi:AraC family carnitine catabolism transcriptional activator
VPRTIADKAQIIGRRESVFDNFDRQLDDLDRPRRQNRGGRRTFGSGTLAVAVMAATETAEVARPAAGEEIGFLLVPQFTIYEFFLAVECLRLANIRHAGGRGGRLFDWRVISLDGEAVQASNGMTVTPDAAVADVRSIPMVLVIAGYEPERQATRPIMNWLRYLNRHGAELGGLSTGPLLLAAAGLLDGHRATIHWEGLVAFQEQFPGIDVVDAPFVIDRKRLTCAGGAAAFDFMLEVIARRHGPALARGVARELIHDHIRAAPGEAGVLLDQQQIPRQPRVRQAVRLMEATMDEPLAAAALAARCGLTGRRLTRLFLAELGEPPMRYYRTLRLDRARQLLLQGDQSVLAVSIATGFTSLSAFSRAYRAHFGHSPRDERRVFRAEGLRPFLPEAAKPLNVDCRPEARR